MEKLRGALIGYGFIASCGHLPAYLRRARTHRDVSIVAIADVCEARRKAALQSFPDVRVYADTSSLLASEADRLDFVDIATPPSSHASIARAAFDRGLHVLCEKPLATTLEDATALLEHATRARRVLFPCHNYLHAPVVKAVRGIIDSGAIGEVRLVTLHTFRSAHARGVSEWRPDWRRERQLAGGGIAMDHGSHTFYLAFDWLNDYPTAVTAKMSTLGDFDTEDNFSCTLTFPRAIATAHLTWTAGARKVIYAIHGDRGAITVDDDDVQLATVTPATLAVPANTRWRIERQTVTSDWMDASHVGWFGSLFDEFKKAIDEEEFVGRAARDAFQTIRLIETAYASAKQGCRELRLERA